MKDSVPTAATGALEELLEVSPQVDAAVILERDGGRLVACAPAEAGRMADQLATTCLRIVDAAEQSRRELGREPVSQVEVGTPGGHVFVVGDTSWIVAAVTDADPTVGLVFYDLKTALRAVREAAGSTSSAAAAATETTSNGAAPVELVTSTGDESSSDASNGAAPADEDSEVAEQRDPEAATSAGDDSAATSSNRSNQRWRRRNK